MDRYFGDILVYDTETDISPKYRTSMGRYRFISADMNRYRPIFYTMIRAKMKKIWPLKVDAIISTRDCNFPLGNHKNLSLTLLFIWRLVGQGRELPYKEDCMLQTWNKEGNKEMKNL